MDRLLGSLIIPPDKCNLITTNARGLIFALFNITLSEDVPFCQPQRLQRLHHDSNKVLLCAPFLSPRRVCGDLWYARYGISTRPGQSALLAGALLTLLFAWDFT